MHPSIVTLDYEPRQTSSSVKPHGRGRPRLHWLSSQGEHGRIIMDGSGMHELLHLVENGCAVFFRACRLGALKNIFDPLQPKFFGFAFRLDNATRSQKKNGARLEGNHGGIRSHVRKQSQG